jgi:nitrate reductase assembly molybdenum cofactor insertion protein NarJ
MMEFYIVKNGKPAKASEIEQLELNENIYLNYYVVVNNPQNRGKIWVELTEDAEKQGFRIVKEVNDGI